MFGNVSSLTCSQNIKPNLSIDPISSSCISIDNKSSSRSSNFEVEADKNKTNRSKSFIIRMKVHKKKKKKKYTPHIYDYFERKKELLGRSRTINSRNNQPFGNSTFQNVTKAKMIDPSE